MWSSMRVTVVFPRCALADLQARFDLWGKLWLHYCLLQPGIHAEVKNQHPAVCLDQGKTRLHHKPPVSAGNPPHSQTDACVIQHHFLCPLFGLTSPQRSPPSHKYPAARTSFPIHLCVCLWAAMSTSLPWKAHVCLRASWLLVLGEFVQQTESGCCGNKKEVVAHISF